MTTTTLGRFGRWHPPLWLVLLLTVALALMTGCEVEQAPGKAAPRMSAAEAVEALTGLAGRINVRVVPPGQVEVSAAQPKTAADTLPPIGTFPLVVDPSRDGDAVVAEVFVSLEKSGTGADGWMVETARAFNDAGVTVDGGRPARIAVRKISSGTAYEFIASGKYRPQGFSPSNAVWGDMARAEGAEIEEIAPRLVGNVAGVVMKNAVAERLKAGRPELSVTDVVDATIQGRLALGYTNPFSSATGINLLLTVLQTFAQGDESAMLTPAVASAFEQFQKSVPFVAMSTPQMRDSVEQDRSLDAFVLEYSLFAQTPSLKTGYDFIPFGERHDNPLFAVGPLSPAEREVLTRFAAFAAEPGPQALATRYGFNALNEWSSPFPAVAGQTAVAAQHLWKTRKDAGRPIAAVFLADVSESMRGTRIEQLRRALIDGSAFISPDNAVGLVTFSTDVTVQVPIKPFQLLQKAAFQSAAKGLDPSGNTAMYDGIIVALGQLVEYRKAHPDVRPMLFVLTDGETNTGLGFDQVEAVVSGLGIPVYTIGFDADIKELGRVSGLVEAASLNASEADLRYKLSALFNAQL